MKLSAFDPRDHYLRSQIPSECAPPAPHVAIGGSIVAMAYLLFTLRRGDTQKGIPLRFLIPYLRYTGTLGRRSHLDMPVLHPKVPHTPAVWVPSAPAPAPAPALAPAPAPQPVSPKAVASLSSKGPVPPLAASAAAAGEKQPNPVAVNPVAAVTEVTKVVSAAPPAKESQLQQDQSQGQQQSRSRPPPR